MYLRASLKGLESVPQMGHDQKFCLCSYSLAQVNSDSLMQISLHPVSLGLVLLLYY